MKKGIHPPLFKTVVTCSCGETFETISTRETLKVEICAKCHPYFTGKKKIMDTGGRLDRFKQRYINSEGAYKFTDESAATEEESEEDEDKK